MDESTMDALTMDESTMDPTSKDDLYESMSSYLKGFFVFKGEVMFYTRGLDL